MRKKKNGMIKNLLWNLIESSIGAFSAVLFFYALRGGDPIFINPAIGFIITIIWLSLIYIPMKQIYYKDGMLAFGILSFDVFVSLIICVLLSVIFKLITWNEVISIKVFGSAVFIGLWMAIPIAVLFNFLNVRSILSRHYFARGR